MNPLIKKSIITVVACLSMFLVALLLIAPSDISDSGSNPVTYIFSSELMAPNVDIPSRTELNTNSCVPKFQKAWDSVTNGKPVKFILTGGYLMNSGKSLMWRSNLTIVGLNRFSCGLRMHQSNNAPMITCILNTNYLCKNFTMTDLTLDHNGNFQNTLVYGGGDPQQGACTANGTNIYCSTIWQSGTRNVRISRVSIIQPPTYGTLDTVSSNLVYDDVDINYIVAGNCGGDGWHYWGDGHDVTYRNCTFHGRQGDVIALNISETKQLVKSPYWSTNINILHYATIENLTVDMNGSDLGLNPINVQVNDDLYSRVANLYVRKVRCNSAETFMRTPFTRMGTCDIRDVHQDAVTMNHNEKSIMQGSATNMLIGDFYFGKGARTYQGSVLLGIDASSTFKVWNGYMEGVSQDQGFSIDDTICMPLIDNVIMNGGDEFVLNGNDPDAIIGEFPFSVTNLITCTGCRIIGGQFNGLGGAIYTNVSGDSFGPQSARTNFVMNQAYSNTKSYNITIRSQASLTLATIAGRAGIALEVAGNRTNRTVVPTTIASALGGVTITNDLKEIIVHPGQSWIFKDISSGAGNSASTTDGEIVIQ